MEFESSRRSRAKVVSRRSEAAFTPFRDSLGGNRAGAGRNPFLPWVRPALVHPSAPFRAVPRLQCTPKAVFRLTRPDAVWGHVRTLLPPVWAPRAGGSLLWPAGLPSSWPKLPPPLPPPIRPVQGRPSVSPAMPSSRRRNPVADAVLGCPCRTRRPTVSPGGRERGAPGPKARASQF